MVSSIVGNYLIEKKLITKEQLEQVKREQQKVRVKLGLIAISEGLMTQAEAERVNRLQAVQDKRFGDIAVENGYLTDDQVAQLLKKQGNAYLSFAQALESLNLMNIEQLEKCLIDFMRDKQLTQSEVVDIKSDDPNRILNLFLPPEAKSYKDIAGMVVRTVIRLVDSEMYPGWAYLTDRLEADNVAMQFVDGAEPITCAFAGKGDALRITASIFGQEQFDSVNMDALDAVGELVNCINGLYASDMSRRGEEMELYPPQYSDAITELNAERMMVLPLYIKDSICYFVIAKNTKLEMK